MKSTKIKISNIPHTDSKIKSIHVKPRGALACVLFMGIACLFLGRKAGAFGIWLIFLALFGILCMPDRLLVSGNDDFLILHDPHNASYCWLAYWSEIESWQYVKKSGYDLLQVRLSDGSVHSAETYSRRSIAGFMNEHAAGKEIRKERR